ncbi:MAG: class I SAM-dependent methyltransferase [Candidatus Electrothrix sp. Rat3]|nr:class I SAM-dependent methyltransferase [Candidatus Electrothrix rattekaaiensis]
MIKNIFRKFAVKIGVRKPVNKFMRIISKDPLNASLHLQYAVRSFKRGQNYLAFAELKTAEFLGVNDAELLEYKDSILNSMPRNEIMNHNQYFRLKSLASELKDRSKSNHFSVLDVGGGAGVLASFIPEASYCLAEPSVNGISGTDLPFPDRSFDYVVSCHVLEHIPPEQRESFLDQLLAKSKYGLILLNPFYIEGTSVEERLKLVIDVTGADWAKEHLKCTLPKIEDVKKYAKKKKVKITIRPNGTLTTTQALVFVDYFSGKSFSRSDREKVNCFFNTNFDNNILDSEKYPVGYLVYLSRSEG